MVLAKTILSEEDKTMTDNVSLSWAGEYQYYMPYQSRRVQYFIRNVVASLPDKIS